MHIVYTAFLSAIIGLAWGYFVHTVAVARREAHNERDRGLNPTRVTAGETVLILFGDLCIAGFAVGLFHG